MRLAVNVSFPPIADMLTRAIFGHMNPATGKGRSAFVAFYSAPKAIGLTALIFALGVYPLLPGVSEHLTYTGFFYTKFGYPFLVAACGFTLFLAAALLPLLFRALRNQPAIQIEGDTVRIFGLKGRDYPLSSVSGNARRQFGNLFVRCPDGQQFTIPLWLYRNPREVFAHLMSDGSPAVLRRQEP